MNAQQALQELLKGNKEYMNGKVCFDVKKAREETKNGQKPFATILSCSDSRVVPEFIFNRNLGELFVVRTAGNVIDEVALGSIEYAVGHLQTPLLVILGHEKCGAVTAACSGGHCEGHIKDVVNEIKENTKSSNVEEAVVENARELANKIMKKSAIVKELADKKKLQIVWMKYHFDDGRVELL